MMKYADTDTLIRLNDTAVRHDFNEWLTAEFFGNVAREGAQHILAYAIPHGVRPHSSVTEPPHHRTVWFAELVAGDPIPVRLDVTNEDYEALPEIPGSPSAMPAELGTEDTFESYAILLMRDYRPDTPERFIIDGKHVLAAAASIGKTAPAAVVRGYKPKEIARIRKRIPEEGRA